MTVGISSIKKEAKTVLKGKWIVAIVSAVVVLVSFLIIQNIRWLFSLVIGNIAANFITLLLMFLICGPLSLGVLRVFWRMHSGMDENPTGVFLYFSSTTLYYRAIRLCFMLGVRLLIFAIIFNLPALAVFVISNHEVYEFLEMPIPIWTQHLTYIGDFLTTIGSILVIMSMIKFYLAPFLFVADGEMDAEEAIHMSAVISKTSLLDFIFLCFSQILWAVLSVLFIPLVFTIPYFIMCYIIHANCSIKDYNERIKKLNDESFPTFVAGV